MKRKVLVTGAGGQIATRIIPDLSQQYELVLVDIKKQTMTGEYWDEMCLTDLLDKNRDTYRHLFKGVDTVIHSGFVRTTAGEDRFFPELDNVAMAYNVYQVSLEEDVRRVIVMSSNHAADYYERLIHKKQLLGVTPNMPAYSDNYYGWAKVAYEALGFVFATGHQGMHKKLENIQLRIGAPRETDIESCRAGDLTKMHRDLGAYLSLRDEIQLITKSIETEDIRDEQGIPFQIFYGISGNTHAFWDISNARRVIGYEPEDDSSIRFSDHVRRITQ